MPAKNLYLAINWVKSNNIPYKVEHYLENLDGTGFDLAETDNLT
jgi:hypothetical protein